MVLKKLLQSLVRAHEELILIRGKFCVFHPARVAATAQEFERAGQRDQTNFGSTERYRRNSELAN